MTTRRFALPALLIAAVLPLCRANEIGYIEEFSLAEDRAVPLKQLMPGTEEYYYYHCLHCQNTGELAKVDELLKAWIDKHGYTPRVEEIRNRQALLVYPTNPQAAIDHIRQRLDLRFDHQKQVMDEKPSFPTQLDARLISRETLTQRAMSEFSNLDGFENSALEFLVTARLDPDRRRDLLHRLERPDYPKLAEMVIADLRTPNSGGFGSHPIHAQLLLTQMEECAKLMPELLNDGNFVNAWLPKLLPGADVDWQRDPAEKQAYLERLWTFVSRLPPAFNSLKTSALFHRLSLDRSQGVYDKDRFMTYLKLPRRVHYINPKYIERRENAGSQADLNANFAGQIALPSIGTDEPLVRDFLAHFLVEAKDYEEFTPYIEINYLKQLFAETKIVNSVGNLEQWYALLPGDRIQALKERIDVELLPTNKEVLAPADPVTLDVALKNVPTLIVKVYEINTLNYYRERNQEISTDVDLDGLVANDEKVVNYTQTPIQRHVEKFEFPNLTKPGVYVIELIGNGRSSRALIRKGRLTFTERIGAAGHVFTVYDSDNKRLSDATVWLGGKEYTPDKSGEIAVPFASAQATVPVVLCHDGVAALDHFEHMPEVYALRAGIFTDRESLLAGRNAQVLVRPALTVNDCPVDIKLLEEPALVIDTVDREGISTRKELKDFKLFDDRESTYEFRVPEKLAQITFTLKGQVQNLSKNEKVSLETSASFTLNAIDQTEKTEDLHLRHVDGQYVLELRGKSGEAKPDRPVSLEFKHRDFRRPVNVTLQTDGEGRIRLGALPDIVTVQGAGPEGTRKDWDLNETKARCVPAVAVHALAGTPISVPFMQPMPQDKSEAFSFLEVRGPDSGRGTFVADCRDQVSFRDGFLVLDDLHAGNYNLRLKDTGATIPVRITQGRQEGSYLLSRDRFLEVRNPQPLQIGEVAKDAGGKTLRILLKNVTDTARVHVTASRFLPAYPIFDRMLDSLPAPAPTVCQYPRPVSTYMSGRNIGDEYRYVLERKYAGKFPGNMLQRPSLLINPWNIRKTETGTQEAQGGQAWGKAPGTPAPSRAAESRGGTAKCMEFGGDGAGDTRAFANLDFLATPSVVLANLKPDKDGVVTVDLTKFGPCQQVHVLAVDAQNTVYRECRRSRSTCACARRSTRRSTTPSRRTPLRYLPAATSRSTTSRPRRWKSTTRSPGSMGCSRP